MEGREGETETETEITRERDRGEPAPQRLPFASHLLASAGRPASKMKSPNPARHKLRSS